MNYITILKEKDKFEKMKDNLRSGNEKSYEIMRLSCVKSKIKKFFKKIFFWYNIKVKQY